MSYFSSLPLVLVVVSLITLSHAIFLLLGKRAAHQPLAVREKLWHFHQLINGTLWTLAFFWLVILQGILPAHGVSSLSRIGGVIIFSVGLLLVGHVRRMLGYERAMGVRFFFPERTQWINDDIYLYLNNPMYDGFVLVLIGAGMMFGIREDFWLAVASFVLFNILLAKIENGSGKWSPL